MARKRLTGAFTERWIPNMDHEPAQDFRKAERALNLGAIAINAIGIAFLVYWVLTGPHWAGQPLGFALKAHS